MEDCKILLTTIVIFSIQCFLFSRCRAEQNKLDMEYEKKFPSVYTDSPLLPLLLRSVARQKNAPDTADSIKNQYDYIVVGAGSAGSVVAARLSEDRRVTVLLLEAGGQPPYITEVPATAEMFFQTSIDWNYTTVPQKYTGAGLINRQVQLHKGKVLGGSSIHHGNLYVRGNQENYNQWARDGATGWSYKDVFPYFLKAEGNQNLDRILNGYHGKFGPLTVERSLYNSPLRSAVYEAGLESGYPIVDSGAAQQLGFDDFQGTLRDQQRCSTAKAYLVPAEKRLNLDIVTNGHANRVLIKNRRAIGVEFYYREKVHVVNARKEVISSAGAFNSAKLLLLSGIGPQQDLQKHGIQVVADLPVGLNLQDHIATSIGFTLNDKTPNFAKSIVDPSNIMDYINNRTGPLTSTGGIIVIAFLKNDPQARRVGIPDYQPYWLSAGNTAVFYGATKEVFNQVYAKYENSSFYTCISQIIHPKSRGTVKLRSNNPLDAPLIDPNYLADNQDILDLVAGLKQCLAIGSSKPLQEFNSTAFDTVFPGCENYTGMLDSYLECQARTFVQSVFHDVGTCKMGNSNDKTTVLDPRLRVKGIKSLRVVDGSIMPTIVSGNTNVPIIMIAEKAADMIKQDNTQIRITL